MEVLAYEAPDWGIGELYSRSGVLVYHELPRPAAPVASRVSRASTLHSLARRIVAFFDGQCVPFDDVQLDLDWCTPFQWAVADVLRRVPYGQTVTYGELAALAG